MREAGLEHRLGNGVDVFLAASLEEYFPRFNALLAETDVLWTKPSEMTFFSALGPAADLLRRRSESTSGTTAAGRSRTVPA